jgi:hypothetical protein
MSQCNNNNKKKVLEKKKAILIDGGRGRHPGPDAIA